MGPGVAGARERTGRMDIRLFGRSDGQMEIIPLCSIGHLLLRVRCPKGAGKTFKGASYASEADGRATEVAESSWEVPSGSWEEL